MNYQRIYDQLIADRRANPPAEDEYAEVHHILPRCMGGCDEAENLIRLRPEDHYMAHLLLAKVHGGKLWFAVVAMANLVAEANDTKERRRLRIRTQFGHVRRSFASFYSEYFSGPDGPNADRKIYLLNNFDNRVAVGNRYKLSLKCGIDRRAVGALLHGDKKSYGGWYYKVHNPEGKQRSDWISERLADPEVHTLYHFDGSVFTGTKRDFMRTTGQQLYWQSSRQKQIMGYYRSREEAARHDKRIRERAASAANSRGPITGLSNPRADKTVYRFLNIKTGERVSETRVGMRVKYGIRSADMSRLVAGKLAYTHGWAMDSKYVPANDNVQLSLFAS